MKREGVDGYQALVTMNNSINSTNTMNSISKKEGWRVAVSA